MSPRQASELHETTHRVEGTSYNLLLLLNNEWLSLKRNPQHFNKSYCTICLRTFLTFFYSHWVFITIFCMTFRDMHLSARSSDIDGVCFWFLNMLSVRCTKRQMVPKLPRVKWSTHVFSYVSKMLVLNFICIFSSLGVSFNGRLTFRLADDY